MATDRLTGFRTPLEGTHGKGMSQVHQPETSTSGSMGNPGVFEDLMKGLRHHGSRELSASASDKEMRIGTGELETVGDIAIEGRTSRHM